MLPIPPPLSQLNMANTANAASTTPSTSSDSPAVQLELSFEQVYDQELPQAVPVTIVELSNAEPMAAPTLLNLQTAAVPAEQAALNNLANNAIDQAITQHNLAELPRQVASPVQTTLAAVAAEQVSSTPQAAVTEALTTASSTTLQTQTQIQPTDKLDIKSLIEPNLKLTNPQLSLPSTTLSIEQPASSIAVVSVASSQLDQYKEFIMPTTVIKDDNNSLLLQMNSAAVRTNALTAATTASSNPNSVSQQMLSLNLTDNAWPDAFGQRIHWMINQNLQSAKIQIHPPELGSILAQIKVHNGQTELILISSNPIARDALEGNLLQLRDMLQNSNVNLTNVTVSDHLPRSMQQDSQAQQQDSSTQAGRTAEADATNQVMDEDKETVSKITDHLVDYYV